METIQSDGTAVVLAETMSATQQKPDDDDALDRFFQTAQTLALGQYSRYRVEEQQSAAVPSFASNGRHVEWDQDEKEEEEDEEEQECLGLLQRRQRERWLESTYKPLQSQLDDFWTNQSPSGSNNKPTSSLNGNTIPLPSLITTTSFSEPSKVEPSTFSNQNIPWIDFYMPPYHPKSCLSLPQQLDTTSNDDNSNYFDLNLNDMSFQNWRREEMADTIRLVLEDCHACQGILLNTSATGWSADLTIYQLQELHDECPSAARAVISMMESLSSKASQHQSWHTSNVHRVRYPVQHGLALAQFTQLAQVVLPLQLDNDTFPTVAIAAAALECASLSYRFVASAGGDRALVGLNSGHLCGSTSRDDLPFGTAPNLTFREFWGQLAPSSRHSMLELDLLVPTTCSSLEVAALDARIQQGTSLERDARMRQGTQGRMDHSLPGSWMLSAGNGGVLTSLSPTGAGAREDDRSLHKHFALSTSLRASNMLASDNKKLSTRQYLSCFMEGMGPRFRPEQSTATVLQQSLEQLTAGGYGAGAYWKSIWSPPKMTTTGTFGSSGGNSNPVLAVLGNTTRRYAHLNHMANEMKLALSPKLRGFYNRDVMQGMLPELEDCQEALAACWDLRDTYTPPGGSGLMVSGDTAYLDVY
jgi:hypothetical protein